MSLRTSNGIGNDDFLAAFRHLPRLVYRDDPLWAPQSEGAVDECLQRAQRGAIEIEMAMSAGAEARAVAILTSGDGAEIGRQGQVGLFECLAGSPDAGVAVLEHCVDWLWSRGARRVVAPRVDQLRAGLQVSGFDLPQTIFTAHNPPHYADMFRAVFDTETLMNSFLFSKKRVPRFRPSRKGAFSIRRFDPEHLDTELARVEDLQREVFAGRIGYMARDHSSARQTMVNLLPVLDPDLIVMACNDDECLIGLLICVPDAWQAADAVDRARLMSVAVAPDWQRRGVAMTMGSELARTLLVKGYQTLEGSWVLESNRRTLRLARLLGAEPGRKFALYSTDF